MSTSPHLPILLDPIYHPHPASQPMLDRNSGILVGGCIGGVFFIILIFCLYQRIRDSRWGPFEYPEDLPLSELSPRTSLSSCRWTGSIDWPASPVYSPPRVPLLARMPPPRPSHTGSYYGAAAPRSPLPVGIANLPWNTTPRSPPPPGPWSAPWNITPKSPPPPGPWTGMPGLAPPTSPPPIGIANFGQAYTRRSPPLKGPPFSPRRASRASSSSMGPFSPLVLPAPMHSRAHHPPPRTSQKSSYGFAAPRDSIPEEAVHPPPQEVHKSPFAFSLPRASRGSRVRGSRTRESTAETMIYSPPGRPVTRDNPVQEPAPRVSRLLRAYRSLY